MDKGNAFSIKTKLSCQTENGNYQPKQKNGFDYDQTINSAWKPHDLPSFAAYLLWNGLTWAWEALLMLSLVVHWCACHFRLSHNKNYGQAHTPLKFITSVRTDLPLRRDALFEKGAISLLQRLWHDDLPLDCRCQGSQRGMNNMQQVVEAINLLS